MISTEETVRDAIVQAIRDIAQRDLGFDVINGNVHDYLLEHEIPENKARYLMADSGNRKIVSAWGVSVSGDDNFYALGEVRRRQYLIEVEGYRAIGVNGDGIKQLIDHARKVRKAIFELGITLDETVTRVIEASQSPVVIIEGADVDTGLILSSRLTITAEKHAEKGNLDF